MPSARSFCSLFFRLAWLSQPAPHLSARRSRISTSSPPFFRLQLPLSSYKNQFVFPNYRHSFSLHCQVRFSGYQSAAKMRLFVTILFAVVSVSSAQHQHQQVDPAYLRQYYQQLAQQGQQGAKATPIYETHEQQQYEQPKTVSFSPLPRSRLTPRSISRSKFGGLKPFFVPRSNPSASFPLTVPATSPAPAASIRARATASAKTIPASGTAGNDYPPIAVD